MGPMRIFPSFSRNEAIQLITTLGLAVSFSLLSTGRSFQLKLNRINVASDIMPDPSPSTLTV